ncbi:MAG TPA: hypothetical protein PKD67_09585 [Ignavibacteriaceae bacterium]|nr:hypothetical protein [Ignavibacteriaceae bacterium]
MNNGKKYKSTDYEMMKCIWMASGIVEYKLCDNQFDCENCQFDKMIRNLSSDKETQLPNKINVTDNILDKLKSIRYDDKIVYLKNNLMVKEICPDTFYLGLNPIFSSFLDTVSSMSVNDSGKNIFTGQKVIEIFGTWGSISLTAPMNFLFYDKLGDTADSSLKSQWFAIIGVFKHEISNCNLYEEEWNRMHQKAVSLIEDIRSLEPIVVNTMLDGGTQIKFLHQLIGKKRYIDILNSLIV